jgi:hypothetical protein
MFETEMLKEGFPSPALSGSSLVRGPGFGNVFCLLAFFLGLGLGAAWSFEF